MVPLILLYTCSTQVWEIKNQRFLPLPSLIKPPTLVVSDYKAHDLITNKVRTIVFLSEEAMLIGNAFRAHLSCHYYEDRFIF